MRINERLAKLQVDQLGLVTYEQARAAGVGYAALDRRRADGSLTLVSPGVLGGTNVAASFKRCVLAEVLSAGATAFASHETAAALWGLMPEPTTIEVTTVLERRPRRGGARMHRSGLLIDTDVAFLGAIPVSAPERTVVDLSSRLTELELGRVIDEALRLRFTTLGRIYNTLERLPRAPGRSPMKLRNVLARRTPGAEASESVLEDFISEAIRRFELPSPVAQHRVVVNGRRRRIDLAYVARKVALEAKGFEYHSGRARFDDDALRSNELRLAGWTVLEFTSAFTDLQIARHVARAVGLPEPASSSPLTFAEWMRLR
jgi:very-short-patch-repair endonuclease